MEMLLLLMLIIRKIDIGCVL